MAVLTVLACVLAPVVAAVAINGTIFALGWNKRNESPPPSPLPLPPGWAIGLIWTGVLAALGGVWALVGPISLVGVVVVGAICFCLTYPFATGGLAQDSQRARVLNVTTLIVAAITAGAVGAHGKLALLLVAPFLTWASYVNLSQAAAVPPTCQLQHV
jgi:hypothetical protein